MTIGIGRATLPAEFFDITSKQMLIQPEPQYAHARLIMGALMMSLPTTPGMGLNIPGREDPASGSPYVNLDQMQLELTDPFYTKAITTDMTFMTQGELPVGHTLRFNRPKFTDSTYTFASREVPGGTTISTTPINLSAEQVSLTIKRWAGPYSNSGSSVQPYAIERFDAARSLHDLPAIRDMHLARDFHKTLDGFGVALFDAVDTSSTSNFYPAGNVIYPVGWPNNVPGGTPTDNGSVQQGDFPFTFGQLVAGERRLTERNIPWFANGKRMAVLTPLQWQQLFRDPEYQRLAVFEPPKNPLLLASYKGTIQSIDIFVSSTLTQTSNTNSVVVHYGQMFGPGMVGVAPGELPKVRLNTQDNYGETPLVVWLWYAAFGTLDNRFGVSMRST